MRYFAVREICGLYNRRPRRFAEGLRRADCGLWANGGNKANSGRSSAGRKGSRPSIQAAGGLGRSKLSGCGRCFLKAFADRASQRARKRRPLQSRPNSRARPDRNLCPAPVRQALPPQPTVNTFVDLARQRASKIVNFVFMLRRTPSEHEAQERRRCDGPLSFARLLSA